MPRKASFPNLRQFIGDCPRFTKRQEADLVRKVREGDEARRQLVLSVLPWGVRLASRYAPSLTMEEWLSISGIMAVKAVENNIPSRGRLTTYMGRAVKTEVRRYCAERYVIRTPANPCANWDKIEAAQNAESLESCGQWGNLPVEDAMADPQEIASRNEVQEMVREVIDAAGLTKREKAIVIGRRQEGLRLATLGVMFGISKERVRQIQKTAEEKLRAAVEKTHGGLVSDG